MNSAHFGTMPLWIVGRRLNSISYLSVFHSFAALRSKKQREENKVSVRMAVCLWRLAMSEKNIQRQKKTLLSLLQMKSTRSLWTWKSKKFTPHVQFFVANTLGLVLATWLKSRCKQIKMI